MDKQELFDKLLAEYKLAIEKNVITVHPIPMSQLQEFLNGLSPNTLKDSVYMASLYLYYGHPELAAQTMVEYHEEQLYLQEIIGKDNIVELS